MSNSKKTFALAAVIAALSACGGGGGGGGGGNATGPIYGGPVPDTISGTVSFQGAPLSGVTVTAFQTNTNSVYGTTTTDASGNYSFANIATGGNVTENLQFWPSKAGYAFYPALPGGHANYLWNSAPQNWYLNSGIALTRAGYNGQFTNPDGGSPIDFTVINFMATSGLTITGANFTAYDGSNPTLKLAATGQSTSYAAGDDAALHKGVAWPAVRFVDNGDGTVADKLTGLTWLKNADCLTPAVWATAVAEVNQLASGSCGLSDGSSAGQWRMPNLGELESIIDVSAANPAVTSGSPFTNIANGIYWSATTYWGGEEGSPNAWSIRMADGRYMNDTSSDVKATAVNGVWAVKGSGGGVVTLQSTGAYVPYAPNDDGTVQAGASLPFPRMHDNGNGTVTDMATGLVWLKQANCIQGSWTSALAAVSALASGQCGLSDGSAAGAWRMPNRNELQSLSDRALNNHADYFSESFTSGNASIASQPAVFSNFVQFQYYWTSTTDAAATDEAWTVFSCDFGVYDMAKSASGYSLAVR